MIHSSRDIGPMPAISARAAAGASGVAPTPRRKELRDEQRQQRDRDERRHAGGEEPADPKPISSPDCRAICTPIGLAEVAVIQRAEETARLAMVQNMR